MTNNNGFALNSLELNPLLEKLRTYPVANKSINKFFISFDKTKIFYRMWKPLNLVKKIIIASHGMGGHGEFFVLLADRLVEHGNMIIVPDYRNHGFSDGKKGDLIKFRYILQDLYHFINFIKECYKNTPIYLFGESMGGTVAINFAKEFPETFSNLSGLILFAPGIKVKLPRKTLIGLSLIALLLLVLRIITPSKRFISIKGREEQGIRAPIHQQYDREDPLHLENISIRYIFQLFKYMRKARKNASFIKIPTIIFQ